MKLQFSKTSHCTSRIYDMEGKTEKIQGKRVRRGVAVAVLRPV